MSTNTNTNAEYGADQIQILEGLEAVRKRPGMYIGSTSLRGLHHLVYHINGHYATTQNAVAHIAKNDSEQIVGQAYAKQYETALGA